MKQLTSKQKKKIIYSFAGIFTISIMIFITVMFYGDIPWAEDIKNKIAASLITYASGLFLVVKIITFIVTEAVKAKRLPPQQQLHNFIKKDMGETAIMSKKSKENLVREFVYNGFKFQVDEKKGIRISFDDVEIMGQEDFYNKLSKANSEFLEHFRKVLCGEK